MTDQPACPVCGRPYSPEEAICPECGWELHGPYILGPITREEQLRYERDLAQARLNYRERQFRQAQARLAALEARLSALEADLSRERDQAQAQLAALASELNREREQAQAQPAALEARLSALKAELNRERDQAQAQVAALKAELNRERDQTQAQVAALKAELNRERDQAQTRIRELNTQLEQTLLERLRPNRLSSELHPEIVRLRTRVRRLTMILLALSGIFLTLLIAIWLTDGNLGRVTRIGRSEPTPAPPIILNPLPDGITADNAMNVVQRARLGKGAVTDIAWTPDGTRLAVASSIGVFLYDAGTLEEVRYIPTDAQVQSIAFAPDGQTLASGALDRTVRLWRVADGVRLRTLEGHTREVNSVAFAPDGQTLTSGADDGTVRLWGLPE